MKALLNATKSLWGIGLAKDHDISLYISLPFIRGEIDKHKRGVV